VKHRRNEKFLKAFGENFKSLRKEKGLSQEDVAYDSGIELRQIGRIERGEVNTGLSTIITLAETLKLPVKQLFEF
jgi:transcriptional regulator with XRE-family HTH domain